MSLQRKLERRLYVVNRRGVRNTTEGFEGIETTDDDTVLSHPPGTSGHRDGQDRDETLRNDGDGKGDSVDGHFLVDTEPSGAKDDECETTRMLRSFQQMYGMNLTHTTAVCPNSYKRNDSERTKETH